jgi:hypothetical protein
VILIVLLTLVLMKNGDLSVEGQDVGEAPLKNVGELNMNLRYK